MALITSFAHIDNLEETIKRFSRRMNHDLPPVYIDNMLSLTGDIAVYKKSPRKGFRYCQNIDKKDEKYCIEAFKALHLEKGKDYFFTDNATTIDGSQELKSMLELHIRKEITSEQMDKMWTTKRFLIQLESEEQDNE